MIVVTTAARSTDRRRYHGGPSLQRRHDRDDDSAEHRKLDAEGRLFLAGYEQGGRCGQHGFLELSELLGKCNKTYGSQDAAIILAAVALRLGICRAVGARARLRKWSVRRWPTLLRGADRPMSERDAFASGTLGESAGSLRRHFQHPDTHNGKSSVGFGAPSEG